MRAETLADLLGGDDRRGPRHLAPAPFRNFAYGYFAKSPVRSNYPAYPAEKAITNFYAVMDIRLLEAFRAVIESGSVTHAANALGVTQPAVSAQIARLQETVGFTLFERVGNRLRPTPEAVAFHADVDRTLARIDDLARA